MTATTDRLAEQRKRYPGLVLDGTWDPDEPPFEVWDNFWVDRQFWVTYIIENYYARMGRKALRRTREQNAEAIIGEVAEAMFSGDAANDPKCREAAWDVIVTVTCERGSRLVIRFPWDGHLIVACDSPEDAWRFDEANLPELLRQLTSRRWRNEWQRQGSAGRAA